MRFTQACTLSASQTTDNSVLSNIMLPWLCLQAVREVAAKFPSLKYEEMIVDNTCMQMVSRPEQFDVLVRFPWRG